MILSRFPPLRIAYHPVLRCRFFHPTPAISLNYNHGPAVPWGEEELKFLTAIVTTSAATGTFYIRQFETRFPGKRTDTAIRNQILRMKKKGVVPGQVRDKEDKPWTDEEVEELTKMATSTAEYRELFHAMFPGQRTDNAIWQKVVALREEGHPVALRTTLAWMELEELLRVISESKTVDAKDKGSYIIEEFMLKFPNHSPEAVRLALDEFSNTGRTRTKTLGGNTPWTEEEYQRFKNHKTGYFQAPDEVLMRAFPNHADNVKSIRQRLRSWRAKDRAEKMVVAERKVEEVGKKKRGRPRSKPMANTEPSR